MDELYRAVWIFHELTGLFHRKKLCSRRGATGDTTVSPHIKRNVVLRLITRQLWHPAVCCKTYSVIINSVVLAAGHRFSRVVLIIQHPERVREDTWDWSSRAHARRRLLTRDPLAGNEEDLIPHLTKSGRSRTVPAICVASILEVNCTHKNDPANGKDDHGPGPELRYIEKGHDNQNI